MSQTRFQATVDVSLITDIAEFAAMYKSGNFDVACDELLRAGFMWFAEEKRLAKNLAASFPAEPAPAAPEPGTAFPPRLKWSADADVEPAPAAGGVGVDRVNRSADADVEPAPAAPEPAPAFSSLADKPTNLTEIGF